MFFCTIRLEGGTGRASTGWVIFYRFSDRKLQNLSASRCRHASTGEDGEFIAPCTGSPKFRHILSHSCTELIKNQFLENSFHSQWFSAFQRFSHLESNWFGPHSPCGCINGQRATNFHYSKALSSTFALKNLSVMWIKSENFYENRFPFFEGMAFRVGVLFEGKCRYFLLSMLKSVEGLKILKFSRNLLLISAQNP